VVEDLEKTVQEMNVKGTDFFIEPREAMPDARIAFVKGPDEDVIELIQGEKPLVI